MLISMKPFRICLVSNVLTPMGGGSKFAGLFFQHLNRTLFDPSLLSGSDMTRAAEEYEVPKDRYSSCNLTDVEEVAAALSGQDIAFVLVGSSSNPSEYATIFAGAKKAGVRLCVLSCIFDLGKAVAGTADLFLCHSIDVLLDGKQNSESFAVYNPVPRHKEATPRAQFRRERGIPEDAFVIAYASSEHRLEFYQIAEALEPRKDVVFLSALGLPKISRIPPNIVFCGILPQKEMPSLYDASEMVLHTRTESFGYSVHQGIAALKPVVALWTTSKNAFAETMWPNGGYLANGVQGAICAIEHVSSNMGEALDRAAISFERTALMVPELAIPRFEALLLKKLHEMGICPKDRLEAVHWLPHWPGQREVSRWIESRIAIETMLQRELFI